MHGFGQHFFYPIEPCGVACPIISKMFEHALRIIFHSFLSTSSYQFGFKRKSSTSLAIYHLKETINYYTSHGSNAYCSFLDASKAFDRLIHAGLFTKLLQRQVPLVFLNLLVKWYSDLQCRVRWGDTVSVRDYSGSEAGRSPLSRLLLYLRRQNCGDSHKDGNWLPPQKRLSLYPSLGRRHGAVGAISERSSKTSFCNRIVLQTMGHHA